MKRVIKIYSLLAVLLLTALAAAHAGNIEKTKKFSKTYSLNNNQGVKISNKFGKVEIKNWPRSEVKVEVTITVAATNDRAAQQLLDNIQIQSEGGNPVSFTTKFSGSGNNQTKNSKMHIDYVVYMPSATPLEIKNEFGNTLIPDWEGRINIEQSFGDVTTGRLPKANKITVKFGALRSASIRDGDFKISYSDLKVDKLQGTVNGKIDFCKVISLGVENALDHLDLKASYSDVKLDLNGLTNVNFEIHTKFGELKNKSGITIEQKDKPKKYGPDFNKTYEGQKGSGKTTITISNSFGDIILL